MTSFDSWEALVRPPEDYLMHFRTRGSKNGVRKYQNPDGTWTELGLRERAAREGWEHDRQTRKAQKRAEKLEKKQERLESRQARKEAKAQEKFEKSEQKRKKNIENLTDEEMRAKLKRAKMEAEYRELTKKDHAVLEAGTQIVSKILDYKQNKELKVIEMNKQKLELARIKTEQMLAKEQTKRAQETTKQAQEASKKAEFDSKSRAQEAKIAAEERKTMEADVQGGLKLKRKADLKRAKKEYRETTVSGAIGKYFNAKARGSGEAAGEMAKAKVESKKRQQRTDDIIRNERKTGEYNVKAAKKGWGKMESTWTREKHDKDRDAKNNVRLAEERTKQTQAQAEIEKQKAAQERAKRKPKP